MLKREVDRHHPSDDVKEMFKLLQDMTGSILRELNERMKVSVRW